MSQYILSAQDVSKRFGGKHAVENVSINLLPSIVTGLIGPNGSGKTTFLNLVSGYIHPDSGRIFFDGRDITNLEPFEIARVGLGRTFQTSRLFSSMSVRENLFASTLQGMQGKRHPKELEEKAFRWLEMFKLSDYADYEATKLSYGQQKFLEIVCILIRQPKLALLDEPASGLNPVLQSLLQQVLRSLTKEGISTLIIEHNVQFVFDICERVIVMNDGRSLAEGTPAEIRYNPKVIETYLGGV